MQVRRDSVQTLAVLAACVLGLAAAEVAAGEPQKQLLHLTPALRVLVMRKPQAMQVRQVQQQSATAATD
jgi:hypothetical protein